MACACASILAGEVGGDGGAAEDDAAGGEAAGQPARAENGGPALVRVQHHRDGDIGGGAALGQRVPARGDQRREALGAGVGAVHLVARAQASGGHAGPHGPKTGEVNDHVQSPMMVCIGQSETAGT